MEAGDRHGKPGRIKRIRGGEVTRDRTNDTVVDLEDPFSWQTSKGDEKRDGSDERLSTLDAGFLFLERPHQNFQIGCVAILDGPPDFDDLIELLDERLEKFPRFRQMPIRATLDLGWPVWREDPEYNIRRHIHHIAVPRPGDGEKLSHVLETLVTTTLPSDRPRWEIHLIEGLEHGRAALLAKVHHSMNDGVSGFHVIEAIADAMPGVVRPLASPKAPPKEAAPSQPPSPSGWDLERGLANLVSDAISDPRGVASRGIRDLAEAAETLANFLEEPPAPMPWNGSLGQGREVRWRSYPIDDFVSLKAAVGGTLNDAVLAVISGALRTYALRLGWSPDQGSVRCIVPANIRAKGAEGQLGNQVTAMFPALPVNVADPVERLHRIREEMRQLKDRKQGRATSLVVAAAGLLPSFGGSGLLAAVSELNVVNTLCTNVPGPQQTLHLAGRKITEIHAIAPLFLDVGVAFAASTYADRLSITVIADPALVAEAEVMADALDSALYETRTALWKRSEVLETASRMARMPTVADLMTRDIDTVDVEKSAQDAHVLMLEKRLAHLPVLDRQARLIGVLTQRDLLFSSPQQATPVDAGDRARMLGRFASGRSIDPRLTTARPDESIEAAERRMAENRLDFLPVVDDAGQFLGLVTRQQIAGRSEPKA
jgi:diacylglycerol O-acyltransferase